MQQHTEEHRSLTLPTEVSFGKLCVLSFLNIRYSLTLTLSRTLSRIYLHLFTLLGNQQDLFLPQTRIRKSSSSLTLLSIISGVLSTLQNTRWKLENELHSLTMESLRSAGTTILSQEQVIHSVKVRLFLRTSTL